MRRPSMDQARLMTRQESDRDRRRRSSVSLDNALGQTNTRRMSITQRALAELAAEVDRNRAANGEHGDE